MPPLHPMIVHFPIALFVLGVIFDVMTAFRLRRIDRGNRSAVREAISHLDLATKITYVLGLLGTFAAVLTGEWLKVSREKFVPHGLLILHQDLAFIFTAWFALLLLFRLRRRWYPGAVYMSGATIGFILLLAIGHIGGTMAWPAQPKLALGQLPSTAASTNPPAVNSQSNATANSNSSTTNNTTAGAGNTTNTAQNGKPAANASLVLQVGSRSSLIQTVQQDLAKLGYFNHPITNYYGQVTADAIKAFQSAHHLAATGQLDTTTWADIQAAAKSAGSASSAGSSGESTGSGTTKSSGSSGSTGSTGSTSPPSIDSVRYQNGYQFFVNSCQTCHSLGVAEQYYGQLSNTQWAQVVSQMQSYTGGNIPNTSDILYYLEHKK